MTSSDKGSCPLRVVRRDSGYPPQIAVAADPRFGAFVHAVGRHMDPGTFYDPVARDHLLCAPAAIPDHGQPESGHVTGGQEEMIGEVPGLPFIAEHALAGRIEILHLHRPGKVLLECFEDRPSRQLLES